MTTIQIQPGVSLDIAGRNVTFHQIDSTHLNFVLTPEDAVSVMMELAGTFPPPALCGSGTNSCEGCGC